RDPVGPLDGQPAEGPAAYGRRQGPDGDAERVLVELAEGQQGLAAPLDVERELTVDQHHQGSGLAARPVPRAGRAVTLDRALGPGERRAVRVGGVGGREGDADRL